MQSTQPLTGAAARTATPKVSIVIPTYNRSNHLVHAIESALAQTFRNHEIIVVDDGSTDGTVEKLKPFGGMIRYARQCNRGASSARNLGLELSRGEWIAFLDSDDLWLPMKLEMQLMTLSDRPAGIDACFTDATLVTEHNTTCSAFARAAFSSTERAGVLDNAAAVVLARVPLIYLPTLLVRRARIQQTGAFDTNLAVSEDTDFLFRLGLNTGFCFVATPLAVLEVSPRRSNSLFSSAAQGNSTFFRSRDYMYRNWLQIIDPHRQPALLLTIRMQSRDMLYDWLATTIRKLALTDSLDIARCLRSGGHSYPRILATLLRRLVRKAITFGGAVPTSIQADVS